MGLGLRPGAKAPDQPPMPYRLRASPRLYGILWFSEPPPIRFGSAPSPVGGANHRTTVQTNRFEPPEPPPSDGRGADGPQHVVPPPAAPRDAQRRGQLAQRSAGMIGDPGLGPLL